MPHFDDPTPTTTSGRRRPPPLPPMRLGRRARAGLLALRVVLGASVVMATFAAVHGPHG
jgi:hypothetical protein